MDSPQLPNPDALIAAKRALRAEAAARRRDAAPGLLAAGAAAAVRDRFLAAVRLVEGAVVSGYWPLADEFDPRPLLDRLHMAGHPIGLPVVVGRGLPLLFRRWHPGTRLIAGGFGVQVPPPEAPEVVPAVVLAPLLAFDRLGYRLGYGGGYYDRTLAKLGAAGAVLAVGLGFACQEEAAVPRGPTDRRLDWIVTEQAALRIDRRDG